MCAGREYFDGLDQGFSKPCSWENVRLRIPSLKNIIGAPSMVGKNKKKTKKTTVHLIKDENIPKWILKLYVQKGKINETYWGFGNN